ncbi:MAG: ATP-binding protein [Actinomycetota bacterium]
MTVENRDPPQQTVLRAPNPFTPGKRLTRPDLFSGRTPQLEQGIRLLRQAASGNARHGLITGDRGIGKSSLASQIENIARGDDRYGSYVRDDGEPLFNFVVAEYIAQRGDGVAELVTGLLDALDRARNKRNGLQWELEIDLKVLKGKARQVERERDAMTLLVDGLDDVWKAVQKRGASGVLLVIDEIDRVAEAPGVGTMFKVATEMLSARGLENIVLLPVGSVGAKELLTQEHASVGRVFDVIHVPLLETEESMDIVGRALDGTGVGILADVNEEIARLASGFPHPVHLIGFEAYEVDDDGVIDWEDQEVGLFAIVSEKWKDEFDADYIAAGTGKNRDILRTMANYDGEDVPSAHICATLGVKQPEISSNMGSLMKRDVIVRTDRGMYRFKDAMFRIYVEYLEILGREPVERRPKKRPR